MNTHVEYTKKPKLYYYVGKELKINKKAMVFAVKRRTKALPRLNKVWVEGKGLIDVP